jgi:hypothetical protein
VWEVEGTDEFIAWFAQLDDADASRVETTIQRLEEVGPGLGQPWADSLKGSRVKELIPRGGFIRILFRFDPRRTAIVLLGGSKQHDWTAWYEKSIPDAERLYEAYLHEIRDEGILK